MTIEWCAGIVFERWFVCVKYACKVLDDELYFFSNTGFIVDDSVRCVGHDALRVNWGWLIERIVDEPVSGVDVDDDGTVIYCQSRISFYMII